MRLIAPAAVALAFALSACGAATESAAPTNVPPTVPAVATTAAPTAAPTNVPPTTAPTSAPKAEPTTAPTSAPTAEPTAAPTSAPAAANAAEPSRLVIDDIKLDQPIVSVGLDKHNMPIVPDHNVGWYNLSARPGQGENIVLWGHVLRFRSAPNRPAPFEHLKQLKPGARITLFDEQGSEHRYVVTKQVRVTPDQVEYILPRGSEMVTMVSCMGDKVISNGEVVDMSHRLVTIAEPLR